MGFFDIGKVTDMGKATEVYVNTTTNPAYAYRVTKTDGSVAFEPLKPFVYWRQPQKDQFEPMNPADVNYPCCRPQPDTINTCRSTNRAADNLPLESVPDTINPSHYKQGAVECIDAIKSATGDGFTGYLTGNILKYAWRWKHKNGDEDLKKARWYLDRLIGELEGE